jgi:8-oxo-dGTP pyrophosphatase MutT (NUDIX family)
MSDIGVVALERVELRFAPRSWAFAEQKRAEIDAHFEALKRDKPDLWNGRVMMLHDWRLADSSLTGSFLETDFASMLAWRDWDAPDRTVRNCFAQAALRAADGAFVLGVMGAHTANAGRIYFPSGTPDPDDIDGEHVDLVGSVMRELAEETGLSAKDVTADAGWHAVLAGMRIALMKTLRSTEPAGALRQRILANLARQAKPELADIRIVRGPADLDPMMPTFIAAYLSEMWKP